MGSGKEARWKIQTLPTKTTSYLLTHSFIHSQSPISIPIQSQSYPRPPSPNLRPRVAPSNTDPELQAKKVERTATYRTAPNRIASLSVPPPNHSYPPSNGEARPHSEPHSIPTLFPGTLSQVGGRQGLPVVAHLGPTRSLLLVPTYKSVTAIIISGRTTSKALQAPPFSLSLPPCCPPSTASIVAWCIAAYVRCWSPYSECLLLDLLVVVLRSKAASQSFRHTARPKPGGRIRPVAALPPLINFRWAPMRVLITALSDSSIRRTSTSRSPRTKTTHPLPRRQSWQTINTKNACPLRGDQKIMANTNNEMLPTTTSLAPLLVPVDLRL